MIWFALAGCSESRPDPVPSAEAAFVRLEDVPFASLEFAESSRPTAGPAPERIPLDGPWHADARNGREGFSMPLPIRPRGMFFFRAESGMHVYDAQGADLPYESDATKGEVEWAHDREEIRVWGGAAAPEKGELTLDYPLARLREDRLNFAHAKAESKFDFVWTDIQDDWDARHGLLLPAPGEASWKVTVPKGGELSFVAGIVEPEIQDGPPSDGARFTVRVTPASGPAQDVMSKPVAVRSFQQHHVDLSAWAGQEVTLALATDPAGSPVFDYVFFAEPVLASRQADPVTVLMVFIDTLRVDHTSLYGYARDTTAPIDHLAKEAAVFQQAYTVAPWTLPSARAIVTGRHPEDYATAETLPELLGKRGFANAFFAGNVYLSSNFWMQRGWDHHNVGGVFPSGDDTTDRALAWLDAHEGRDRLLQVHYMDAHLPYHEPRAYRRKYAGDAHPKLGERFEVQQVRAADISADPVAVQYIQDRYDNNIRFVSDQIARLLARLDDNDILLVYADHGEEFWEHGRYEHGHALYQELMHVPLVIDAPGVDARNIESPVSLVDLVPTILDLVGAPIPAEIDGRSLVPLLRGEAGAADAFRDRTLAFGRPLYGMEQWGVLQDQKKWTTSEGREALFDLAVDPAEKANLVVKDPDDRGAPYRALLAAELDREVPVSYRLAPSPWRNGPSKPTWVLCTVPGGFSKAWPGDDPLQNSFATTAMVDDPAKLRALTEAYQIPYHTLADGVGGVEICWPGGYKGGREVYVLPAKPLEEVGRGMICSAFVGDETGGKRATMLFPLKRSPTLGELRIPIEKVLFDERALAWQYGIGPVREPGEGIVGHDAEMKDDLAALGYVEADKAAMGDAVACTPPKVPLAPAAPPKGLQVKKP